MPVFRTTEQIFKGGVHFDQNWLDLPPYMLQIPKPEGFWTDKKEIRVEDVDFWEVIQETGGGNGIYAAYQPYAEIYLVRHNDIFIEVFSGANANARAEKYCIENKIKYPKIDLESHINAQK